jgi:pimeloyl-ACP methyl ester carboxylesterase
LSYQYSKLHKSFNIAAINLPGHGKSGGKSETDIHGYVERLKDILDILRPKNPVLIGHSLGAAIVQSFAAKYPKDIQGIVLVGGGPKMPVNPDILEGLQRQPEVTIDMICKFALAKENRPKLFDILRVSLAQGKVDVLASDLLACSKFDGTGELKMITTPALVICGSQDKMTPPESSKQITAGVTGAQLVLIEGAGHMVMMEKPDQFNDAITAFCSRIR